MEKKNSTTVHIFQPQGWYVYLVITPSTDNLTYIITFDLGYGSLFFSSTPCVDVFSNHRNACNFIRDNYKDANEMKTWSGYGLIGVTIEQQTLVIALITNAKKVGTLPNGSVIQKICDVQFIQFPFKSKSQDERLEICGFPIQKKHFYCVNYDITRPYPSNYNVNDYDPEFCWNQRWRIPFVNIGLENICIVMVQGYAKTSNIGDDYEIAYIARRSVLNPFTRYSSRGLNHEGVPGNEVECELIFFNNNSDFISNCWRRGSIPIKWSSTVNTVSVQHVVYSDEDQNQNQTLNYFKNISNRFGGIPITIISLLKNSKNESQLNDKYRRLIEPFDFVEFLSYDFDSFQENQCVDKFDKLLEIMIPLAEISQFTKGTSNIIIAKQQKLLRFNCVDSIDRTNAATFIFARALLNKSNLKFNSRVYDFLARAFIKSGDNISLLYTTTPAARSQIIRNTVGMIHTKSDTLLGVNRRINYFTGNNQCLNSIIAKWISKEVNTKSYFNIDCSHTALICDSNLYLQNETPPNSSIIGSNYTYITAGKKSPCTLIFELPVPMVISVLRMMIFPFLKGTPYSFSLYCGMDSNTKSCFLKDIQMPTVNKPIFVKYSLYHSSRWGFQAPFEYSALKPAKFIWIEFTKYPPNENIIQIGNISFDGYVPKKYLKLADMNCNDPQIILQYRNMINDFLQKKQNTIEGIVKLETFRIKSRISLNMHNLIMISQGINPKRTFMTHLLHKSKNSNMMCTFCHKPLSSNCHERVSYFIHEYFHSLIDPSKPQPDHPKAYSFCQECIKKLNACCPLINDLNTIISLENVVPPPSKNWTCEKISGDQVDLTQQATFFEYPKDNLIIKNDKINFESGEIVSQCDMINSLLKESGGRIMFDSSKNKPLVFTISFFCLVEITKLELFFDDQIPYDIIISNHGLSQFSCSKSDSSTSLCFKLDPTSTLSFKIIPNTDQNVIIIKKIKCHGKFVERAISKAEWYNFPLEPTRINRINFSWDPVDQMQLFKLVTPIILKKVTFFVSSSKSNISPPQSIILAQYDSNNKLVKYSHFLIPLPMSGTDNTHVEMNFRIINSPLTSTIKLFYLDILEKIRPYDVNFIAVDPNRPK